MKAVGSNHIERLEAMNYFWVSFNNRESGTIEAADIAAAREAGKPFGEVTKVAVIPYPSRPVLVQSADNKTPPFCYSPDSCQGRTSCPNSRACSE